MEITKQDKKNIVKTSKEVVEQSSLEIQRFTIALKRATLNKATAEALIKQFK